MRTALTLLFLAGCSSAPAAETPEPEERAAPKRGPSMAVTSEVGALDEQATHAAFQRMQRPIARCLERGARSIEAIGGHFTLALRIRPDGRVESAHLPDSTLGHRETERCILEAARAKSWPRPVGGVAEAEHSFEIESSIEVHEWDGDRLRPVMQTIREELARCVPTVGQAYQSTLYIDRAGQVRGAGVAAPSPEAQQHADCVAEVLAELRFGPQRQPLTKVTFEFR